MSAFDAHRGTLTAYCREMYRQDWAIWELPGLVRDAARRHGLRLTAEQTRSIIGEAVPHAAV